MTLQIPTVTIDDLRAFHAKHFPHAPTPQNFLQGTEQDATEEYCDNGDELGYYSDGTERTLTDEQIAIFRHSEIRAILQKRRLQRQEGEVSEEGEAESGPSRDATSSVLTPKEDAQAANVEKPKAQWATSSARTKARNKKHRNNYRARLKRERAQKESRLEQNGDEESDEWDPWHQATGPDAQKEDTIDLEY